MCTTEIWTEESVILHRIQLSIHCFQLLMRTTGVCFTIKHLSFSKPYWDVFASKRIKLSNKSQDVIHRLQIKPPCVAILFPVSSPVCPLDLWGPAERNHGNKVACAAQWNKHTDEDFQLTHKLKQPCLFS